MSVSGLIGSAILVLSRCGWAEEGLPVHCLDEPDPGPYKARFTGYFYNYRYDRCREFHYGDCRGWVPFETRETCETICTAGGSQRTPGRGANDRKDHRLEAV